MTISRKVNIPKNNSFFLFGPRQVGKSTLLQNALASPSTVLAFNLLEQRVLARLSADPDSLRQDVDARSPTVTHVFIDEVQKLPSLLDVVHGILERPNPPHFVLTGSSARRLRRENANLLAGRALERHLYPLTHLELGEKFDLQRALSRGTLPRFYLEPDDALAADLLQTYVSIYLTEEIQQEAKIRAIGPFSRFLLAAAGVMGNQLNYAAIARESGTADKTVREYFQILEDTLLGWFLRPFSNSNRKRLAKHPKFYLFDPGVARCVLGQESARLIPGTKAYGDLFELWALNETRSLLDYSRIRAQFSFFRIEKGPEIDLVIEFLDGRVWAVEFKSATEVPAASVREQFEAVRATARVDRCIVVYTGSQAKSLGGIDFLPWRDYFQQLLQSPQA